MSTPSLAAVQFGPVDLIESRYVPPGFFTRPGTKEIGHDSQPFHQVSTLAFMGPGGGSLRPWLHRLRGAHIGKNVWISHFVYIDDCHPDGISIGDNCAIGLRTTIFAHLYWGPLRHEHTGKVVIERDVFVGPHCVILPDVTIGEGAVLKAGTVVSRNVPPHTLWGPRV
jgi:tetrahydrodipicolinate N-succinyltransferase